MVSNSAISRTFIYSDIFDFPLTKEEIWKFLIGKKIRRESFEKELSRLVRSKTRPLRSDRKLYYLFGRKEIVEKRIRRKKVSQQKLVEAKRIINVLSLVPTVLFIGISGGLALENADEKDDIDLFIITSKNSLWITRLILVFLLIVAGQYRGRGKKESQKICLNMLIDEKLLMFEKYRQNLYTAHEIAQLKPMLDRNNTYKKFINANRRWMSRFLPNAMNRIRNQALRIKERKNPLFIIEKLAKTLQLWYMKKHITKETVSDNMLAFHPFEYGEYVLKEYNKRLKQYEI